MRLYMKRVRGGVTQTMAETVECPRPPAVVEPRPVWAYPSLRPPARWQMGDDFEFLLESNHYKLEEGRLVVCLHGATIDGRSVFARVTGYRPYFFIRAPDQGRWSWEQFTVFLDALEGALRRFVESSTQLPRAIRGATSLLIRPESHADALREGLPMIGFRGPETQVFYRITCIYPTLVEAARTLLEFPYGLCGDEGALPERYLKRRPPRWYPDALPAPHAAYPTTAGFPELFQVFESNIDFMTRFRADHGLRGMCWVRVTGGRPVPEEDRLGLCTEEIVCDHRCVAASARGTTELPPLIVLSYDIEAEPPEDHTMPSPGKDRVLQIGCRVMSGRDRSAHTCVHALGAVAGPSDDYELYTYPDELSLLRGWAAYVRRTDPDFLIGYNTRGFDNPYLVDRFKALAEDRWSGLVLGRERGVRAYYRATEFNTSAHKTQTYATHIPGRLQLDYMQLIMREHKLRSYRLEAVAQRFLKMSKVEMDYRHIRAHQRTPEGRRRLADYCRRDADLPLELLVAFDSTNDYAQKAHISCVTVEDYIDRGQQMRILALLLNQTHTMERPYFINTAPPYHRLPDDKFKGAIVIDQASGYYDIPVLTLDYAGLYPSIIRRWNLCYTTYTDDATIARLGLLDGTNYTRCPDFVREGDTVREVPNPRAPAFLTARYKTGLLPAILTELTARRKEEKKLMALHQDSDPGRSELHNLRQAALKLVSNAIFGFTGTTKGAKLPLRAIAETVTAYGRGMNLKTQAYVQRTYTRANGFPFDARIVYGDTDSVFVAIDNAVAPVLRADGSYDFDAIIDYGMQMARECTESMFEAPISLEFEKVYATLLLLSKKRYAGERVTVKKYNGPGNAHVKETKVVSSGMENVRRDSCSLVSEVVDRVLAYAVKERDLQGAVDYVRGVVDDLNNGRVPYDKLIISKGLSKRPEQYKAKSAHTELAKKMARRDPNTAPRVGDRVQYVVLAGTKGAQSSGRAEDPLYAFEQDLQLDTAWYLENQLAKPLHKLFYYLFKNTGTRAIRDTRRPDTLQWLKDRGWLAEPDADPEEPDEEPEPEEPEPEEPGPEPEEPDPPRAPPAPRSPVTLDAFLGLARPAPDPAAAAPVKRARLLKEMAVSAGARLVLGADQRRRLTQRAAIADPLMRQFVRVQAACQACGTRAGVRLGRAVCADCAAGDAEVVLRARRRAENLHRGHQTRLEESLSTCRSCVQSNPSIDLETCRNTACSNFWARESSRRERKRCEALLALEW